MFPDCEQLLIEFDTTLSIKVASSYWRITRKARGISQSRVSSLRLNFKRKWNGVASKSGLLDLAREFRQRQLTLDLKRLSTGDVSECKMINTLGIAHFPYYSRLNFSLSTI